MRDAGAGSRKLVVLASHPIQYRSPLYRRLAEARGIDLEVWYGDAYGVEPRDSAWGLKDFTWDQDLLEGYRHRFLRNVSPRPSPSTVFGKLNPEIPGAVRDAAPDAAWISGYGTAHEWVSYFACRRARVPILYSSDSNVLAEPGGAKGFLKRRIVRRVFRLVSGFLVNGILNDRHYDLYEVPRERRFRVPWAIDNDRFAAAADRERATREQVRAAWGVASERTVALFAGQMLALKRVEDLIEVAQQEPSLHLVLAGGGPLLDRLRELAAAKLPGRHTVLGFVSQTALPGVYAAADLLVLPSSYEAWGLVINEALACGTPAIASDRVGAAHDLLPANLRFPVGDIRRFREALSAFAGLREREDDLVAWSRARVRDHSFERDVEGIQEALERVTRRDRRREGPSRPVG